MKAGGGDLTVQQGDVVVTEDRAKKMSQPRDAAGKPLKPTTSNKMVDAPSTTVEPPKGNIRSVGPTFIPAR